jgi:hypothetical protein
MLRRIGISTRSGREDYVSIGTSRRATGLYKAVRSERTATLPTVIAAPA